jgi:FixJ family two-component response regulator
MLTSFLLANELGGAFDKVSSAFVLRAKSTVNVAKLAQQEQSGKSIHHNMDAEPPSCNASGPRGWVPEGLSIAILDDNTLVRRNVERMCRVHLKASALFASGLTVQECHDFPEEIIERNVDISIVDENLDLDDGMTHISGTDLCRHARANGFKGCLILHSAQSPTKALLDQCLDGFVEKTADREAFCSGIAKAWKTYRKRIRREQGKEAEEDSPVIEQAKLSKSS